MKKDYSIFGIQPLTTKLSSTTLLRAFIFNSMAASIIIFLAVFIKGYFDNYHDDKGEEVKRTTTWESVLTTLGVTFIATFIAYIMMWYIGSFGGGMIAN